MAFTALDFRFHWVSILNFFFHFHFFFFFVLKSCVAFRYDQKKNNNKITESCILSNNIMDYHVVSQGKTSIPGVADDEEFKDTDVS